MEPATAVVPPVIRVPDAPPDGGAPPDATPPVLLVVALAPPVAKAPPLAAVPVALVVPEDCEPPECAPPTAALMPPVDSDAREPPVEALPPFTAIPPDSWLVALFSPEQAIAKTAAKSVSGIRAQEREVVMLEFPDVNGRQGARNCACAETLAAVMHTGRPSITLWMSFAYRAPMVTSARLLHPIQQLFTCVRNALRGISKLHAGTTLHEQEDLNRKGALDFVVTARARRLTSALKRWLTTKPVTPRQQQPQGLAARPRPPNGRRDRHAVCLETRVENAVVVGPDAPGAGYGVDRPFTRGVEDRLRPFERDRRPLVVAEPVASEVRPEDN